MNVFATDEFIKKLYRLRKKRRSICTDIGTYLRTCVNVDNLIKKGEACKYSKMGELYHPYKNRVPIAGEKSGTRGGWRLISLVEINANAVFLLDIYPKSGAGGKADVSNDEWKEIFRNIRFHMDNGFEEMLYNPELVAKYDHKEFDDEIDLGSEEEESETAAG